MSNDTIQERIARTEEQVIGIREELNTECVSRQETDKEIKGTLRIIDKKIDQILHNDMNKLQRIASLETQWRVIIGSGGIITAALTVLAFLV